MDDAVGDRTGKPWTPRIGGRRGEVETLEMVVGDEMLGTKEGIQ